MLNLTDWFSQNCSRPIKNQIQNAELLQSIKNLNISIVPFIISNHIHIFRFIFMKINFPMKIIWYDYQILSFMMWWTFERFFFFCISSKQETNKTNQYFGGRGKKGKVVKNLQWCMEGNFLPQERRIIAN